MYIYEAIHISEFIARASNYMYDIIHSDTKFRSYFLFTFHSQRTFTERQSIIWINTPANIVWIWLVEKQVKVIGTGSISSSAQDSSKYFSFVTVCNQKLIPPARLWPFVTKSIISAHKKLGQSYRLVYIKVNALFKKIQQ